MPFVDHENCTHCTLITQLRAVLGWREVLAPRLLRSPSAHIQSLAGGSATALDRLTGWLQARLETTGLCTHTQSGFFYQSKAVLAVLSVKA